MESYIMNAEINVDTTRSQPIWEVQPNASGEMFEETRENVINHLAFGSLPVVDIIEVLESTKNGSLIGPNLCSLAVLMNGDYLNVTIDVRVISPKDFSI